MSQSTSDYFKVVQNTDGFILETVQTTLNNNQNKTTIYKEERNTIRLLNRFQRKNKS